VTTAHLDEVGGDAPGASYSGESRGVLSFLDDVDVRGFRRPDYSAWVAKGVLGGKRVFVVVDPGCPEIALAEDALLNDGGSD
jgi:hypothetical protein